nr:CRISPR-associated helicase Cas3' [Endozoicomonas sp.]
MNKQKAIDLIKQTVASGRCICWIRNTVKDARSAYQTLQQQDWMDADKLTLFHSRFAMVDRQVIEADVLKRFGKNSTSEQRLSQVLIATQVVEQSLDLDFDVMISDLAPVDLLIQRAGRLQRHIRDIDGNCISGSDAQDRRDPPCLYLLSPDPGKVEHKNWLRVLLPGTQAVYINVGQLWLTIRVLLQQNGFSMPQDARHLIESVYGRDADIDIPEVLEEAFFEAKAEQKSQQGMGEFNQLEMRHGYTVKSAGQSGGWDEDVNIPTRLTGDSASVILAIPENNKLVPYAQHKKHGWSLSKISLPKHEWEKARESITPQWLAAIEQLKIEQPALKWQEILPLTADIERFYQPEGGWDLAR